MTASLGGLVAPDGSVTVPAEVVGDVLRALIADMTARARTAGALPSPVAEQLLHALYAGKQRHEDGGAPPDTPPGAPPAALGRSVREVADEMGCSPQYVRRLLAAGHLAGRRTPGGWIVHTGRPVSDPQLPQQGSATLITATERQAREAG